MHVLGDIGRSPAAPEEQAEAKRPRRPTSSVATFERHTIMMDFIFVVLIVGFFAASVGLVRFCARLLPKSSRP